MAQLSAPRSTAHALATPLPVSNRLLNSRGIAFRRGQFSMLAAAPSVGKSVFATNLAVFTKVPTLIFSADSDEWTVKTRVCSILTGHELNNVEENLNDEDSGWEGWYQQQLRQSDHIDFSYRTDIEMDYVVWRMAAYAEVWGDYPELTIVDNLGNTVGEGDEFAELRLNCRELQRVARTTGSHVMGLHHVVGAKENGYDEIGLGDLMGKLGKIPELVLGMNWIKGQDGVVNLTVPKNRGGKGRFSVQLGMDYSRATIEGYR
jgi:hypothetical protein